ncbi:MAG: hypothetical protein V1646_02655 [bacterium]
MMQQVLQAWKESLTTFLPNRIKSGLISVVKNYISVVKSTAFAMRWFLVGDLFLMAILAEAMAKKITSGAGFAFLVEITNFNWLIIYSAIIILIRKRENPLDAKTYLKSMFFKSINGLFIFMIFQLIFFAFLVILGITQFPNIPWVLKIIFQIFEMLMVFYWLDSPGKFTDFIACVEKIANLVFYNMPVFLIFLALLGAIGYFAGHGMYSFLFLDSNASQLLQPMGSRFAEFWLIFIKYVKTLYELFWLCILFLFYDKNRNMFYSKSIFEHEENEID